MMKPPLGANPGYQPLALKEQYSQDHSYSGAVALYHHTRASAGGLPQRHSDVTFVRTRGKNNIVQTRTGSVTHTQGEMDLQRKQQRELSQATKRLKVLEQIEGFREKRIHQEMMALEMQRREQEEKMLQQLDADRKKQKYLDKQK